MDPRRSRALVALDGLSVGDAFGQRAFGDPGWVFARSLPPPPWRWTDDTAMAIDVVAALWHAGAIDPDALARAFARRWDTEPNRGYGAGAAELLSGILRGMDWRVGATASFGGTGSFGNGAAMRVAPLGAWFADDVERAAAEARVQAQVTHAHVEGIEAAAAVAVATAQLASGVPRGGPWLAALAARLAPSETRRRIERAAQLDPADPLTAARTLGTGQRIAGFDTVPFCLWVVAHHHDWATALFTTAAGFGDVDTTCAIVGGLIAVPCGGPPEPWRSRREPLPDDLLALARFADGPVAGRQ